MKDSKNGNAFSKLQNLILLEYVNYKTKTEID